MVVSQVNLVIYQFLHIFHALIILQPLDLAIALPYLFHFKFTTAR